MSSTKRSTDTQTIKNQKQPKGHTAGPKKSKRQAVVIYNTMAPTPEEDWVLYGDEAVTVKHSSVRQRKADRVCRTSSTDKKSRTAGTTRLTMLPTPPGSSPAYSERERKYDEDDRAVPQVDNDYQRQPTSNCLNSREVGDSTSSVRGTDPYRTSTPDLSDVEENVMFAPINGNEHWNR
ncbi:MAG: hypothetical protein Q9221_001100 [Calogaya cf. arnoldii]